jgi:Tol biopolymer transport system component
MKQDVELRRVFEQAADALPFEAERSLERFHAMRPRRVAARRVAAGVVALAVAAAGLLVVWVARPSGTAHHRPAETGAPTGTIAFMRATGDGSRATIESVPVAGGQETTIAAQPYSVDAVWSPDGSLVAYGAGAEFGTTSVYVAQADGSDVNTKVWPAPSLESLSWSPDGARIAYVADDGAGEAGLYVIGADGTGRTLLLQGVLKSVAWSPDGSRLLITGRPGTDRVYGPAGFNVWTVQPDGTGLVQLTHGDVTEEFASWSPDGTRILFTRGDSVDAYAQDVYVMDADGSNVQPLTDWPGFDSFPVWSPDGSWIVFASDRDATPAEQAADRSGTFSGISLYVMGSDGSDVQRVLAGGSGEALLPSAWRP